MGGNALATVDVLSKRLNKKDFDSLKAKVVKVLNAAIEIANEKGAAINNLPYEVKAYREKETFGDLDLLVDGELFKFVSYQEVMEMLRKEFNHDGPLPFKKKDEKDMVMSFGLPSDEKDVYFQLDLISSDREYYNFQSSYLNWNDLGNLIGVVASSNGFLKYGHNGLLFQFREGDNLFTQYTLTTDWDVTLDFFGYSKEDYDKGFDKLQDIYNYAASSKFFSPTLYSFENRNHTQRTRDRKRPTYNGFLKWIEESEKTGMFEEKTPLNSEMWLERVYEFFPWFKEVEKNIWEEHTKKKEFKSYFNGGLLLKFKPELKNREISDYLKSLKDVVTDLNEFVMEYKEDAMRMLVEIKDAE